MPRGKKVSPVERRNWLAEFEQGTSVSEIATRAKRAVSAVRTHIEVARNERDQGDAKAHLTRKAYEDHYQDLLDAAELIRSKASEWKAGPVSLPADTRSQLLVAALEQHAPSLPLWEKWDTIESMSRGLAQVQSEIKNQVAQEAASRFPELNADGITSSIVTLIGLPLGLESEVEGWYRTEKDDRGLSLIWGAHQLASGAADAARIQEIRSCHSALSTDPNSIASDSIRRYQGLVGRGNTAEKDLDEEVERLQLRRVLPGRCSLCPDSPLGRPTRRRKTKPRNDQQGSQA